MEEVNKPSVRLNFPKIQQKIQKKYNDMQMKIEKSRYIDSVVCDSNIISSNIVHNNISDIYHNQEMICNKSDEKYTIIIEEVKTNNVIYQDVGLQESSILNVNDVPENFETLKIGYPNNKLKLSTESINEICKETEEDTDTLPSASPKISLRERFLKRRRESKEKKSSPKEKKESCEKVEKFIFSNTKRTKVATVTIALIEVTGLPIESADDKLHAFSCRFSLGAEKQKSKLVKSSVSTAKFQELFNMNLYEEHYLRVFLLCRDEVLGRSVIDLSEVEKEKTHRMRIALEGEIDGVQMFILLTISGTSLTLLDLNNFEKTQAILESKVNKCAWYRRHNDMSEVGNLTGIVYGAKGLAGQDFFCVFQLGNERLQTHTEYKKTNDPTWMKYFHFKVKDITEILNVKVYDEKKSEEVGRISIPLLNIENGEKKWYMMKNAHREIAKGNSPKILLEMRLDWDIVKAALRVINPKEENLFKTERRFHRLIFANNLSRARVVFNWVKDTIKILKSCFEWESRTQNVIALVIWIISCSLFKVWMFPLLLLIPFVKYGENGNTENTNIAPKQIQQENVEDEMKSEKEEKSSLRQKLNNLQEMVQSVQNLIGEVASLGESVKNLFNFTVPFLSYLSIFIVFAISFIMFLIPFRYIMILWGIHKFARKILLPNRIPNNEILDLLSRVPDDETLLDCKELPLQISEGDDVVIRS